MIELKYTIPKINGKDLSYRQIAILLGYEPQIEGGEKTKSFTTEKSLMIIVEASLSAKVDREKKEVTFTSFIENPVTPEQYVQGAFQNLIKEKLFEILRKNNAGSVAAELTEDN